MNFLQRLRQRLFPGTYSTPGELVTKSDGPTEAQIIDAMDPWLLCNAVGSYNKTNGFTAGFDSWYRLSKDNWLSDIISKTHSTEKEIRNALVRYAQLNADKNYRKVYDEENSRRGRKGAPILGPGESMTVALPVTLTDYPGPN